MTQIDLNNNRHSTKNSLSIKHIPVLLEQVLDTLSPKKGESYLDLTAGYGGHAGQVLERTFQPERATLVDRDQNAVAYLQSHFSASGVNILSKSFLDVSKQLVEEKFQFDMILVDLGVSSPQLDEAMRGFSIQKDGPLDMRMDKSQKLTAGQIVNDYSLAELTDIIQSYGEEPKAGLIAKKIISNRPITTTHQLATIVAQAWPGHSRVHPATRTFQALRIAVNDELKQLIQSLPLWVDLLAPDGRLAVISFHSLEDRIVKTFFKENSEGYEATVASLTKKPLLGSKNEIDSNPRARSAKLRAVAKIKINKIKEG